jgi:hypothetical protein
MSQELSCYHGHRFEVPQEPGGYALCPLCGAITRYKKGNSETKGHGAHQQTLNQPHIGPLETSQSVNPGKTLEIDSPSFRDQAVLKTGSFDEAQGGNPPGTNADGQLSVERDSSSDPERPDAVDDGTKQAAPQADSLQEQPSPDVAPSDSVSLPKTVSIGETVRLERTPQDIDRTDGPDADSATDGAGNSLASGGALRMPTAQVPFDETAAMAATGGNATTAGVGGSDRPSDSGDRGLPSHRRIEKGARIPCSVADT